MLRDDEGGRPKQRPSERVKSPLLALDGAQHLGQDGGQMARHFLNVLLVQLALLIVAGLAERRLHLRQLLV